MSKEHDKIKDIFMKSYEEHSDAILRYCHFQTSNREIALDLVQDTFMKTWSYLSDGNDVDNIKAFLYKVAKNLIIDYRRKKKAVSLDAITDTGVEFAGDDGTPDAETEFDKRFVISKLGELDEESREILTMRYVNEMSIKEIAEATEMTPNNVSVKIHRSIDKLKEVLKEYYDTL